MADHSKIEWTDASLNPIRARTLALGGVSRIGWFCEHVTEACRFCYAESMNRRLGTQIDYRRQDRDKVEHFLDEKILMQPLHWKRPRKIFWGSMTDLFGDWVTDEMLDACFAVMALTPQHTHQLVTKRPARMRAYISDPDRAQRVWTAISDLADRWALSGDPILWALAGQGAAWGGEAPWPLKNVWLLVSVHDQASADEFVPIMLDTPAAIRGVSYEPALGPVDWTRIKVAHPAYPGVPAFIDALIGEIFDIGETSLERMRARLDWIICGGESGSRARPMHPDWARQTRDQCAAAGVAYFFKQWGEWAPMSAARIISDGPVTTTHGDVKDWMRRSSTLADGTTRILDAHSFTRHATDLSYRVGKKAAGRLLDGVEHNAFPNRSHTP